MSCLENLYSACTLPKIRLEINLERVNDKRTAADADILKTDIVSGVKISKTNWFVKTRTNKSSVHEKTVPELMESGVVRFTSR